MCLLLCRGLPGIPTEELQTLQLFNYLHFTMLCAMHSILEQSKRGRANPTISCSTLCSFRCFLRCKAFQSIAKEVLQTLQSVSCSILCILMCLLLCRGLPSISTEELQTLQLFNFQFFTFLHASFSTKLKCKNIYRPCGKFHFRGSRKPYSQSVVPFSVFYHAFCYGRDSRA